LVMRFSKTMVTMDAIVMTSALLISLILTLRSNGGHLELKRLESKNIMQELRLRQKLPECKLLMITLFCSKRWLRWKQE
jgi:hypothetical protein